MASSLLTSVLALSSVVGAASSNSTNCRCFPGDSCWPSQDVWSSFNKTVDGQLVATVPLGKPCHSPSYDAGVCNSLRDKWEYPEIHYDSTSSIMAPFFANGTCDPYHPVSKPCTLGNYIVYAVNVTKPDHVSASLKFATEHNIRLVVRNTGHDYNGKSTGAGALGLWTHNLKDIEINDYKDSHYTGKAIKMGAGVQGFEAYQAANNTGLQVVGGECPTVGIAGGYSQGGGHSALASRYGLAADQVLQWEVIDGEGNFRTATRDNENSDLYWALSGGGGGTYGVVWSLTSKAHTSTPVSGLNLTFTNAGISQDTFYQAAELYHETLPSIVDAGAMSVWYFTNTSFYISPLTGPNIPVADLVKLVKPFTDGLTKLGVKYTLYSEQFTNYLDEFNTMQSEIQVGIAQYGGWLVPRSVVQNNNADLTAAYRHITEDGATFIGVGLNVSKQVAGDVNNAVLPAWRETLIDTTITTPWDWYAPESKMVALQDKMTNDYIPRLAALAPKSGAYMNEGDFRQPNFQSAFYGVNYERLRQIKAKYDPNDIFYAKTAVGSDEWSVSSSGRLCRA
ncbi:hypothetical protein ASPWEDRAFT_105839 [Aspergillus wentii DTO 134E9]|uniref:FAD-binding PCMH-type domain-containing protein n=1 Tax=Aspergillus wentii DTO 134E9 TaxID=1073089 RepID=A0A1L9RTR9_ASPWE|nr:uncharacterized protein ASPWEDRAFT_105839 [Aspergillus wentii DTO 134E9]OJJ38346.1 hypothetical protein ASPWEDRAFT_105839 [Aspergillus wentii DTO 134E9]